MNTTHVNHRFIKVAVIAIIALWFVGALTMGFSGQFGAGPGKPPVYLGLAFAVPILVFVVWYLGRGSLWAFAQTLDLKLVTLLHVWRLLGIVFLVKYLQGQLPGGFAFPAGVGDMLTALAAIPMAMAIAHRTHGVEKWFVAWNLFGLADLIVAVGSGILHSPSSFGILAGAGPTTAQMSQLPLSLIPTFLVPLFILLHLLALARAKEIEGEPQVTEQRTVS